MINCNRMPILSFNISRKASIHKFNHLVNKYSEREIDSLMQLSGSKNCKFWSLRVRETNPVLLQEPFKQLLRSLWLRALAFNLIIRPEIEKSFVQLQIQSIPRIHRSNVPEPSQTHQALISYLKLISQPLDYPRTHRFKSPWLRHAGTPDQRFDFFFDFFGAADAVWDLRLGFEGENAAGIEVVEPKAEDRKFGGELGGCSVEEDVLLD